MKSPNRTFNPITISIALFILTASSIPNIWANTNPENTDSAILGNAAVPSNTGKAPLAPSTVPADTDAEVIETSDPLTIHLTLLCMLSDELLGNLEAGILVLPLQESLKRELKDTKDFATQLLTDIKAQSPDLKTKVLVEFVIGVQIDRLKDLINGKKSTEQNVDDLISEIQASTITDKDLEKAILTTNQKFKALDTAITKKSKTKIDRVNDQVLKQLCFVDTILEELAQFIDNQSIKVANKRDAIDAIKTIRAIIEPCKYDRSQVDENRIDTLLALNKYLIEHIKFIIKNNFKDIPEIDIDSIFTRGKREITLEELDEEYLENEELLASLRNDSQNAGLTMYNHFFRKLDEIWTKYFDGGSRILWPTVSTLAASAVIHQLGFWPEAWDFYIPFSGSVDDTGKKLPGVKFYGKRFIKDPMTGQVSMPKPEELGLVGNIGLNAAIIVANPAISVPVGFAIGYGMSDFKRMYKMFNEKKTALYNFLLGKKAVKKNNEISRIDPKYTFDDVVGQQEIKDSLSTIVRYFEDPQGIDNRGLKLEKGYLFTGKARSGKSFMVEALAGEIRKTLERNGKDKNKFNFLVAPADFLREPGGFRMCMELARRSSPCILFIDEIHLLELQAGKNNALLGEFLTELSGCMSNDPESKVFVIAATNQEDSLDKALRQSGRLSKEVRFEYPTYADRKAFIINILEKRSVNTNSLDISKFARESEDCTYEDIRKTIEDAFITAKFNVETLSQRHLDASFDKNIRGIIMHSDRELSEQERGIVAIHQAGYTLATKLLAPKQSIAKVTTLPIREAIKERSVWSQMTDTKNSPEEAAKADRIIHGKLFTYSMNNNDSLKTIQEQINACTIALAGYAAGNVLLSKSNNSNAYLAEKRLEAFEIAKKAVLNGINIDQLDDKLKHEYLARAMSLRNACYKNATTLLEQNKEALQLLARALLEYETLTGRDIDALMSECTITPLAKDNSIIDMMDDMNTNPAVVL